MNSRDGPSANAQGSSPTESSNVARPARVAQLADSNDIEARSSHDHDHARQAPPSRFIGYLSPEAVMSGHIREPISGEKVGGWVPAADEAEGSNTEQDQDGTSPNVISPGTEESLIHNALQAYLDAVGVATVPDARSVDVLLGIYFEYVHPLLPLVDQKTFYDRKHAGTGSRMLMQAICLVASRHEGISHHLYLANNPNLLPPRQFAKKLYTAIVAGLNANLEKDRITVIQVLTLISLHSEGIDGADQASMHLVQAIHHAHTMGLQFGRQQNNEKSEAMEKLFWCLWALDKMNATIHGRPQYMHERDNQLENWTAKPERRRTPFAIWLVLAAILDSVIELYRPNCDPAITGLEESFPGFEDIIGEIGDQLKGPIVGMYEAIPYVSTWTLRPHSSGEFDAISICWRLFPSSFVACCLLSMTENLTCSHLPAALELFYHAVAMASHKSRSITDPVRSTPSSVRQSLSAVRVISILSNEFPSDLPPLPIVPYSLALAMTVAYRQFRRSKLQGHKNRAKEDLKSCCNLLDKLRATWWSAGCMADLGFAALAQAERASAAAKTTNAWIPAKHPCPNDKRSAFTSTGTRADASMSPTAVSGSFQHATVGTSQAAPSSSSSLPTLPPVSVPSMLATTPQPAISSERSPVTNAAAANLGAAGAAASEQPPPAAGSLGAGDLNESPDWLNFDNAFENMDTLLGSGGADLSTELLRGLDWDWAIGPGA